jgi:DNA repair protein RecN (Recombination protein N)
MRKYGSTLEEVLAFAAEARARLEELEQYDARAAHLEDERRAAEAAATRAASSLTKARRAAVEPLGDAVTTQLRALAMPKASVTVALEPSPLTDDGADDVTFLLAPNPGEPPRPLARTASGGELSRTMLALRVVLSEAPPTLVFDEVDAGIGGEAGTAVGRALALLGGQHQVLCVTHLAQVAAAANAQIAVTKQERDGRTVACAEILLDDARINEISRMLAGVEASSHARKHARELLQRSKVPKP